MMGYWMLNREDIRFMGLLFVFIVDGQLPLASFVLRTLFVEMSFGLRPLLVLRTSLTTNNHQ
jgi:hypothetical protein